MRLITWNLGHGSPRTRTPNEQLWRVISALDPDAVLAQETRQPEVEGYHTHCSRYPKQGCGGAIAVRAGFGDLTPVPDREERSGLMCCGLLRRAGAADTLVVSLHVPADRSAQNWLRKVAGMEAARGSHVLIGGDFNAGPSIGRHPAVVAAELDLQELSVSEPERNTLVRAQHPTTTFQIDHVLGRGWRRQGDMCLLPFADAGGPQLSDHNALWLTLTERER